jgi:hypothetical protein
VDTCVPTGDGGLGSVCDTTDFGDLVPCDAGLYCDGQLGTCQKKHRAGETCDQSASCDVGTCDSTSSTCRERYCDG